MKQAQKNLVWRKEICIVYNNIESDPIMEFQWELSSLVCEGASVNDGRFVIRALQKSVYRTFTGQEGSSMSITNQIEPSDIVAVTSTPTSMKRLLQICTDLFICFNTDDFLSWILLQRSG
jgi:hypothetical protein